MNRFCLSAPRVPGGRCRTVPAFASCRLLLPAFAAALAAFIPRALADAEIENNAIMTLEPDDAAAEAARIHREVPLEVTEGFEATLWASEHLLADPVALHVDERGRVLVTQTRRYRRAEFDIRNHPDWRTPSIKWQTVEDRRAFLREELAPERSDENTWLRDYNEDGVRDWRDLRVPSERVSRIEDTTGDGLADRSQVFYEGFNDEVSDVAAGVFSLGDDVYVTVAPDLWRLRDTTGDGRADVKESLVHGFGINITMSGHGLSGVTMGPDGRLYWAIGDPGLHVEDRDGRVWDYANQGAIMRANPDGTDFEVFAGGLRNTHEFVFDKYGNLISVDNDGDYPGESERLVHVVDGSDSGWRINWQFGKYTDPDNNRYNVWTDEELHLPRFDGQAAYILPPVALYHAGPSGLAYHPGAALNDEWRDFVFVSSFRGSPPISRVGAFRLEEAGAGMKLAEQREVLAGLPVTSLAFGPEGALYLADWIEGWGGNGKGRIWKLDTPDAAGSDIREETRALLVKAFGEKSVDELSRLLRHADMRVRQKAQFELAGRGEDGGETLYDAARQTGHLLARLHGLWGLGQRARRGEDEAERLVAFLGDPEPEVRAQAAKVLGDIRHQPAGEALADLLGDNAPRTRFFAAEALGRIAYEPAIGAICDMLVENNDEDAYLRHAGALALARIGNPAPIVELASHPSHALRIAAVVALRRMRDPGVARFLSDENDYIVTEAARAINDDHSIEHALPALARVLEEERFTGEALLRRSINANLRLGGPEDARRVASFAAREHAPEAMRVESLAVLGVWPEPSVLDRVDGRYRGAMKRDSAVPREALAEVVGPILEKDSASAVRIAAAEAVARLGAGEAAPALLERTQRDESAAVRAAAMNALHAMEHELAAEAVVAALEDSDRSVRAAALRLAPRLDGTEDVIARLLAEVLTDELLEEQQAAVAALGAAGTAAARRTLDGLLDRLLAGDVAPEIQLDVLEAAERHGDEALLHKVETYRAAKPENDPVAARAETLRGGDFERGRGIFREHQGAACIRCHAVGGEGGDVGPDLTAIGAEATREELLQALIDPSARITPGYGIVMLVLENGERLAGTLNAETVDYLEMNIGNSVRRIEQTAIAERRDAPSSMPSMTPVLTEREIRDIVEYLRGLR